MYYVLTTLTDIVLLTEMNLSNFTLSPQYGRGKDEKHLLATLPSVSPLNAEEVPIFIQSVKGKAFTF